MAKDREGCIVCSIIDNKIPSKKIYEDDIAIAVLDVNGANPGHCFIMPKNHYPILEKVPNIEIGRMFQISNKLSKAIFESIGAQGTNIFVANGIPAGQTVAHFTINVIPRRENDGINLQWQPKQLNEEEMSTVELKLREENKNLAIADVSDKKDTRGAKIQPPKAEFLSDEEGDYLSRQMRRLP